MMKEKLSRLAVLIGIVAPALRASAKGSASYDFKDPKSLNSVMLILDSPLEPMVAIANGIRTPSWSTGNSG